MTKTYIAKRKLSALITKFYPDVSIRFIITSSLTFQKIFSFKDKLPFTLVSSVIYQYSCGQCSATYIGETRKRIESESVTTQGYIFRTGNMLNSVQKSKILDHSLDSGHFTSENIFKILDSCQPFDLRILESIYSPCTGLDTNWFPLFDENCNWKKNNFLILRISLPIFQNNFPNSCMHNWVMFLCSVVVSNWIKSQKELCMVF